MAFENYLSVEINVVSTARSTMKTSARWQENIRIRSSFCSVIVDDNIPKISKGFGFQNDNSICKYVVHIEIFYMKTDDTTRYQYIDIYTIINDIDILITDPSLIESSKVSY